MQVGVLSITATPRPGAYCLLASSWFTACGRERDYRKRRLAPRPGCFGSRRFPAPSPCLGFRRLAKSIFASASAAPVISTRHGAPACHRSARSSLLHWHSRGSFDKSRQVLQASGNFRRRRIIAKHEIERTGWGQENLSDISQCKGAPSSCRRMTRCSISRAVTASPLLKTSLNFLPPAHPLEDQFHKT